MLNYESACFSLFISFISTRWNKNLPDFLRSYTATSVINRLLSAGIEIFQRRKDYLGAIELLRKLLSQTTYNCSHRGYWWERLALNLDAHMKDPLEVISSLLDLV